MVRRWRERLAADLGLKVTARHTRRWTDKAIEVALDGFVKDRDSWPSQTEFRNAGLGGLPGALRRCGDQARWAHRYGLELNPSGNPRARGGRIAVP